jgi:ankyrin repeat protein
LHTASARRSPPSSFGTRTSSSARNRTPTRRSSVPSSWRTPRAARFHRFEDWPDVLAHDGVTVDPRFEAGADAVVSGDAAALRALLGEDPSLSLARSPYGHHATLLQHVSANGIEESRQWQSPPNAVEIAKILLDAGAEVDAICDTYGPPPGGDTAMTLLVSSAHPAQAGVQVALVDALADAGASLEGLPHQGMTPILTAVRFGYPKAAEALARRGARVDNVVVAAGLGRIDLLTRLMAESAPAPERLDEALRIAAMLGHADAALLLVKRGANMASQDDQGFTALHSAAWNGHLETMRVLLDAGAPLEVKNIYGGTVLDGMFWAALNAGLDIDYVPVIAMLVAAGADLSAVGPYRRDQEKVDALLGAAGVTPRLASSR